jgi:hypothetical protein
MIEMNQRKGLNRMNEMNEMNGFSEINGLMNEMNGTKYARIEPADEPNEQTERNE